jgi:phosphatidylserine/phosphatidylglycerophosphate/cardiolipin synthase-like enzyme
VTLLRSLVFVAVLCLGTALSGPAAAAQTSAAGSLRLLVEPQAGMAPVDELLGSARHSVELELYELADPVVESILANDAARGVRVRVILDRAYVEEENAAAFAYLSAHHVAVRWAPARFDLDHEKAAVIDDATALVMTMNFTARYYATTRDVVVVDSQPADVAAIETTFDGDWSAGGATPAPNGEDLLWSPGSEQAIVELVDSARGSIDVENEEMDDTYVTAALAAAALRGVKVVVVMTADSAWDEALDTLARRGSRCGPTRTHRRLSTSTPRSSSSTRDGPTAGPSSARRISRWRRSCTTGSSGSSPHARLSSINSRAWSPRTRPVAWRGARAREDERAISALCPQ